MCLKEHLKEILLTTDRNTDIWTYSSINTCSCIDIESIYLILRLHMIVDCMFFSLNIITISFLVIAIFIILLLQQQQQPSSSDVINLIKASPLSSQVEWKLWLYKLFDYAWNSILSSSHLFVHPSTYVWSKEEKKKKAKSVLRAAGRNLWRP